MPLSPHFILPAPCTFMTSRSTQPLPGVRELFPDLFYPRSIPIPYTPYPTMIHRLRQHNLDDATNPQSPISRHHQPSYRSTAQDTATSTSDQSHRYTRGQTLPPSHVQPRPTPHPTERWPGNDDPAPNTSPRSTSPEFSPRPQSRNQLEHPAGPSSLPEDEQLSSPLTSSPRVPSGSTELPSQPTPFDQRSLESHSGKKRHKCNVCGSYWGRPSSLKIHMVSHTGVKEFICSICKQDFGVKSNYTRHIRVHHKDSSEGTPTRVAGRRRRGSRRARDVGPVRFVDEGPRFTGQ